MASRSAISLSFVSPVLLMPASGSNAGGVSVYWGQNLNEGTLQETCGSENYEYVTSMPISRRLDRKALTTGVFNFVWVLFYNNPPCQYSSGHSGNLLDAWKQWASDVPARKMFLRLPASPAAAGSGFIPAADLISQVLPAIKGSSKYGGVML